MFVSNELLHNHKGTNSWNAHGDPPQDIEKFT